ncbi:MAG: SWIM zinc finger family protein [bacterium]
MTILDGKYLRCSCGFFSRMELPCRHVLRVTDKVSPSMCGLKWWMKFHYLYLKNDHVTEQMKVARNANLPGVPVQMPATITEFPHFFGDV